MTQLSEKEQLLEKKAVELSTVIKDISIGSEIDTLRKEVGYKSRDDFER